MALDAQIDQHARDFVTRDHRMLIGGDWVEAASGQTFETYDPATGDVLGDGAARLVRRHRPCRQDRPRGVRSRRPVAAHVTK